MKFCVLLPPEVADTADPTWLSEFAVSAEQLGFDEISLVEHSVVVRDTVSRYPYSPDGRYPLPDDCALPDPLEALAFIAARTSTLGLATGVLVLPNQHPVVLAKRIATLDRLSAGRLRVCIGLGWMKEEIEACGGDFERRGPRADDAIELMRALWRDRSAAGVDVDTPTYQLHGALSWPKPVRPDGVPLYIGGHSIAAARRAGRIGDGFQPLGLIGDELRVALGAMSDEAERVGRDPADVDLVLGATVHRVDERRIADAQRLGASRLVLSPSRGGGSGRAELLAELAGCAARLGLTS
jgi:probable F420-dependent oxidoreductase